MRVKRGGAGQSTRRESCRREGGVPTNRWPRIEQNRAEKRSGDMFGHCTGGSLYFYAITDRAFSSAARGAEANGQLISLSPAAAAWELLLSRAALGRAAAHLNLLCQLELAVWVDNDHWYGGRVGSTVCRFLRCCRCCCRQLCLLLRGQRGRVPPVLPPQRAGNDQQADGHCHQEADARNVSHCGGRRAGGQGGRWTEGVADCGVARRRQLTPVSSCTGPATTSVSPSVPL